MAKRQSKKKELDAVNVHNQQEMINLKLHPNYRVVPDFSKDSSEKGKVYKARKQQGRDFYNQKWANHEKKYIPYYDKLILYVKGENTKSIYCNQADIPEILIRLKANKKELVKYQWNGRSYQANELPFYQRSVKGGRTISVRNYAV